MAGSFFNPNSAITRADMAYWLYNYATSNSIKLEPKAELQYITFSDISGLSADYQAAINTLTKSGVISGFGTAQVRAYQPNDTSTRAEVAAIVAQFVKAYQH